ncbi:unnamed protein product [Allacma fusca]|uniref:EXPERA domain-containing protein n=1 Tax=Allacma fusca TaxID=39272 RepID=A0A8J2K826_9HEXA|nr:unnamed protein product [Allacma fusca]
MSLRTFLYGLTTNLLVGFCCYLTNLFIEHSTDPETRLTGGLGLGIVSAILIVLFVSRWATLNTWRFHAVNMVLFLHSSFNFFVTIDKLIEPNGFFLTEYIQAEEPLLHNVWTFIMTFFDGIPLHIINYTIFYRVRTGLTTRSLLLFNTTACFAMLAQFGPVILTSGLTTRTTTKIFLGIFSLYAFLPAIVLHSARDFQLENKLEKKVMPVVLSVLTVPLLALSALIFISKALTSQGILDWPLDVFLQNDPMIVLNDIKDTYPYALSQIWVYLAVILPTIVVSIVYHFRKTKPHFLWEMSIVQASVIATGQAFFLMGPLYWETPEEFRVDPLNMSFWAINLIPVAAGFLQLASIYQYNSPLLPPSKGTNYRRHSYGQI